jgi:hypothetical protein
MATTPRPATLLNIAHRPKPGDHGSNPLAANDITIAGIQMKLPTMALMGASTLTRHLRSSAN